MIVVPNIQYSVLAGGERRFVAFEVFNALIRIITIRPKKLAGAESDPATNIVGIRGRTTTVWCCRIEDHVFRSFYERRYANDRICQEVYGLLNGT
jgi:hypothetical protein